MTICFAGSRVFSGIGSTDCRAVVKSLLVFCFFVSQGVVADVLVRYEPGANDQVDGMISDQPLNPDVVKSASLSASLLFQSEVADVSRAEVWPVAATDPFSTLDYVGFSVAPHPTAQISFDRLSWAGTSYSDSAVSLTLRTSLDGFATDVATFNSVGAGYREWLADFDLAALPAGIAAPLEFRIYPGNTGLGADWVDLTGTLGGGLGMGLTLTGTATEPPVTLRALAAASRASAVDAPADGVFDEIVEGDGITWNGYSDMRHVAEFDLAPVPLTTVSAVLAVQSRNFSAGPRTLQLHGYHGDGAVMLEDFTLGGMLGASPLLPGSSTTLSFDITPFILDLVRRSEGWAGFNLREEPPCDSQSLDCLTISIDHVALEIMVVETVFEDGFELNGTSAVPLE